MTTLASGEWVLTLRPELGGAIGSLTLDGRDVLRPTKAGETDPLFSACFPLLPYCNRIDHGRFTFEGHSVALTPTPRFEPHVLHGTGWLAPWILELDGDLAVMRYEHPKGDWPWAFEAEQRFYLTPEGLAVTLTMTNLDVTPMPGGLGLHPYFARRSDTRLRLKSQGVWLSDETQIPVRKAAPGELFDWSGGPRVDDAPFIDNAYAGWDGVATVSDAEREIVLTAGYDTVDVHVFAPPGENFFCVEPVTHRPNALNAPADEVTGVRTLAPGEVFTLTMTLARA